MRTSAVLVGAILATGGPTVLAHGQISSRALIRSPAAAPSGGSRVNPLDAASLDSLIARAQTTSPVIQAAEARIVAARARVAPSGELPDPMLMLGLINQPLGSGASDAAMGGSNGPEPMTMRMVGVTQTLPYPGKRGLQRRAAELEVDVTRAAADIARRQVTRDVKAAWYEIAFVDQAQSIVERNRDVLAGLIHVTEARYGTGMAGQQDVLRARVEATRLAETASALIEQRRAAVARLNGVLDQPAETAVPSLAMPERIARAAVKTSADEIRFASNSLGARVADSPLRPLEDLQAAALFSSPELREQEAMIAEQGARLALVRKASLPDVDIALQYGQRGGGLPDMVSATISIPLPIHKARRQDQQTVEATAELSAVTAERAARASTLRAEVARMVAEIERERTRLALSVKAILPQGRAALASAASSYQAGKVEFLTVLEKQATVFSYETEYFRALSDFATMVAELERVVGEEVLR
jgi:cobalt-zinc-cadmium efflux system outer membrane protein